MKQIYNLFYTPSYTQIGTLIYIQVKRLYRKLCCNFVEALNSVT